MDKAPDAFRTISEVAEDLDIPQHVLRFWESRFPQIRPMKRAGGRRYYRPDDVDLLRGIRHLLYGEHYTIKGVLGILKDRDRGSAFVQNVWRPGAAQPEPDGEDETDDVMPSTRGRAEDAVEADDAPPMVARVPVMPQAGLSRDDARKLQGALHELTECRRLLDEALKGEAP